VGDAATELAERLLGGVLAAVTAAAPVATAADGSLIGVQRQACARSFQVVQEHFKYPHMNLIVDKCYVHMV